MNEKKGHPCPRCGSDMDEWWRREDGEMVSQGHTFCHDCPNIDAYAGKYKKAILDALNVLGIAGACKAEHCAGCDYERGEAQAILYAALGIRLHHDPVRGWEEVMRRLGHDPIGRSFK